jgi:predicted secreted acid phosphatase
VSASSLAAYNYYMARVAKSLETKDSNYLTALARQHFLQTVEAIRIGRNLKLPNAARDIKLSKKNPKLKTVCLDLDETLIHCDENSNNYTVKLDFPV